MYQLRRRPIHGQKAPKNAGNSRVIFAGNKPKPLVGIEAYKTKTHSLQRATQKQKQKSVRTNQTV
jgi:hypothetical protein